jgi:hypothetical protein
MIDGIAMQFARRVLFYRSPMDKLQQNILDREILGLRDADDDTVYGPGNVMVVWVATLLAKLPFVNETQWRLVLSEAYGHLSVTGESIATAINPVFHGEKPADTIKNYQLAFVDGRFVTWDSMAMKGFLDIETGDHVEQLQYPALESLSYNLTELARRELRRFLSIEKKQESTDAGANHSA